MTLEAQLVLAQALALRINEAAGAPLPQRSILPIARGLERVAHDHKLNYSTNVDSNKNK